MKWIGASETYDAKSQDVFGERIFEFDLKRHDYFLTFHPTWDRVVCSYNFKIGRHNYHIPSGVWVLIGFIAGETDWILSDELINMDVDVVTLSDNLDSIRLYKPKFEGMSTHMIYTPRTKNILPMCDESGSRCILFGRKDLYHQLKDVELQEYSCV